MSPSRLLILGDEETYCLFVAKSGLTTVVVVVVVNDVVVAATLKNKS